MNDISIVSHIKNDIEFVEQFWKHIHSYEPREIIILDTGSIDGTYEALLNSERHPDILYKIEQFPHYTGMVFTFNKIVEMATSTWVIKLDADELLSRSTQSKIFEIIEEGVYNCISIPTIHHFINSDLFFDCLKDYPDYHQRIFKKEIFNSNVSIHSKNHGSIMWNQPFKMITLDFEYPLYHYSFLRSFKKIQKRAVINYYIDTEKITDNIVLKNIEENIEIHIKLFQLRNTKVTPVWQLKPTIIAFNDLEDYYISEFLEFGKIIDFEKPEDLIVNRISKWAKAEEMLEKKRHWMFNFFGQYGSSLRSPLRDHYIALMMESGWLNFIKNMSLF